MSFKSKKNACFYINSHTLLVIILTYHVTLVIVHVNLTSAYTL